MGTLYENIEALCAREGITVTEMCRRAGVPRGNLSDLKMGRQASLNARNLEKLAACLQVSVGTLLGTDRESEAPTQRTKNDPPAEIDRRDVDQELKFALFGGEGEITDEMFEEVRQFARFVKMKHQSK